VVAPIGTSGTSGCCQFLLIGLAGAAIKLESQVWWKKGTEDKMKAID